jgi:hypothetical protein
MSGEFKPLNDGWGIQPIGPSPMGGGDIHDTFRIDPLGDIYGGHTTVQIPGGQKIHMPWDPPNFNP